MNKHSQTATCQSHTCRLKDHLYEHVPELHVCAHTHTKTCKLGYTLLQAVVRELSLLTHLCTIQWAPVPLIENSGSPSPTFKICPSIPFHPGSPTQLFIPGQQKLFPCLDYGLLLLQNHQRGVLLFPTPFHASLSFSFTAHT